jgi:Cholesterol oxidase, substrate-binding
VPGPYNYPWMNTITDSRNALIRAALFADPKLTPVFTAGELAFAQDHLAGQVLNGTARDLEIYLKDTTLRVALFGWVLQLPRAQVQQVASLFFRQVNNMLTLAQEAGKYPINTAVEIRCTTVDRQAALNVPDALPPALAATHSVDPQDPTLDTVIWLNVGAIPGTPGSSQFLTELEGWIFNIWGSEQPIRLRPEWSKGWAWTPDGPWLNHTMLQAIRAAYNQPTDEPLTFTWAGATLAKYDKANIFTNPFLQTLFSG